MTNNRSRYRQFITALGWATLTSTGLFLYGAWRDKSIGYDYLLWNLFLAWLPLLFALRLTAILRYKLWSSWEALGMSVLWLTFLPNSFYMISDFIHLQDAAPGHILYDTVMFTSFIYTAVLIGFASLYLIHLQLKARFHQRIALLWIALTLLICSFGIYLGRDLRWNSWDILVNPGGLLFDVSDRLLHPNAYPQMILTVVTFFALLLSMYNLVWRAARLLQSDTRP
jgi:uncharacterized membrane protein